MIHEASVHTVRLRHLRTGECGEGVISTAIAVLIMALIGGLMWIAFSGVFEGASERVEQQVEQIGS